MCTLLQERYAPFNQSAVISPPPDFRSHDALLLRGAVFYISMSLWGVRKVAHLDLTFASVLPSIKQVSIIIIASSY